MMLTKYTTGSRASNRFIVKSRLHFGVWCPLRSCPLRGNGLCIQASNVSGGRQSDHSLESGVLLMQLQLAQNCDDKSGGLSPLSKSLLFSSSAFYCPFKDCSICSFNDSSFHSIKEYLRFFFVNLRFHNVYSQDKIGNNERLQDGIYLMNMAMDK